VRQTLTENVVLGGIGAAVGIGIAYLALPFVVSLMPGYIPHLREIVLRPEVFGAALTLALAASALVGLLPAVQATSRALADTTRTASRSATHTGQWPRRLLARLLRRVPPNLAHSGRTRTCCFGIKLNWRPLTLDAMLTICVSMTARSAHASMAAGGEWPMMWRPRVRWE
jgi:hypothetical protein